jgi:hypothetical protein
VNAAHPRSRRPGRLRGLLPAALAAAVLSALGAPGPAAAQPLLTGVTNLGTNAPLAFQRTRDAGARFVRIQLYWGGTAPTKQPDNWNPSNPDDPAYDWVAGDEAVRNAIAAGLTPVLQVDGTPQWAQRCQTPGVFPGSICDPNPGDLRDFATAAASHYSGRTPGVPAVKYFQGLNEPNLSLFFFPQYETSGKPISPFLYRDLINAFYAGVKAAEPSDLVVMAGLGPIEIPKYTIGPMKFARLLLCMKGTKNPKPTKESCDGGVHFDIFAIQPYTTGSPTHQGGTNDVEIGDLPKLQTLIQAADRAGRIVGAFKKTPLWVTEFSWDSKPPDPGGLPMRIETRWVAEALHVAWSAGVENFFWYSLRDGPPPNAGQKYSETLESGLYFRGATLEQDQPKPFLSAFRFPFVAYPGKKLEFWGRTPSGGGGKVKIELKQKGGWKRVATVRADKDGIFRGKLKTSYGQNRKGAARAIVAKQASTPFAMKPVEDFYHPPFGGEVTRPGARGFREAPARVWRQLTLRGFGVLGRSNSAVIRPSCVPAPLGPALANPRTPTSQNPLRAP